MNRLSTFLKKAYKSLENDENIFERHCSKSVTQQEVTFGRLHMKTDMHGISIYDFKPTLLLNFIDALDRSDVSCHIDIRKTDGYIHFQKQGTGVQNVLQVQQKLRSYIAAHKGLVYSVHLLGNVTPAVYNTLLENVIVPEGKSIHNQHKHNKVAATYMTNIEGQIKGRKAEVKKSVKGLIAYVLPILKSSQTKSGITFTVDKEWTFELGDSGSLELPTTPDTLECMTSWLPVLGELGAIIIKPEHKSGIRVQMGYDKTNHVKGDKPILTASQLRSLWASNKDSITIALDLIYATKKDLIGTLRSVSACVLVPFVMSRLGAPIHVAFDKYESIKL